VVATPSVISAIFLLPDPWDTCFPENFNCGKLTILLIWMMEYSCNALICLQFLVQLFYLY
jgi:hypothetical protein